MDGQNINYRFGNKNNWRRWAWNKVRELIDEPKDKLVIYLAGLDDLDREVAIQKGLRSNNLIAIENNKYTCKKLRERNVLTISGELLDVLEVWSEASDRKVGVIFADMMHGLEKDFYLRFTQLFAHPAFDHTVVVCNLMRGRDESSYKLREYCKRVSMDQNRNENQVSVLHRGVMFYSSVISGYVRGMVELNCIATNRKVEEDEIRDFINFFLADCRPSFRTYKSISGQVFDSVVFRSPWYSLREGSQSPTIRPEQFVRWAGPSSSSSKRQKRKNAAILAHRTMRMQAV